MKFFDAGDIRASYDWFDKATQTVPLRTRIGGLATLQKAVVLDSMGYNEEAKGLYKKLKGHAVTSVARKAKQLVFGFEVGGVIQLVEACSACERIFAVKGGKMGRLQ